MSTNLPTHSDALIVAAAGQLAKAAEALTKAHRRASEAADVHRQAAERRHPEHADTSDERAVSMLVADPTYGAYLDHVTRLERMAVSVRAELEWAAAQQSTRPAGQ